HGATDALSLQPELKFCAVALSKVHPEGDLQAQTQADAAMAEVPGMETDVLTIQRTTPVLGAVADLLEAALRLEPLPPPVLSAAETTYLSGFISGLKTPGARGHVPVLPVAAPIAPATRLWLDGVFAGLLSRATEGAPDAPTGVTAGDLARAHGAQQQSIALLWASQTGNSEALAERLAAQLKQAGIVVALCCMADYAVGELGKAGKIILISSTYGDGDAPDNGKSFWEFLAEDNAPKLEHLSYAVCGLGDSSYDQFCQHGKNLDTRLAELGAQRLVGRLDCDSDYEAEVNDWIQLIGKRLTGAPLCYEAPPSAQAPHSKNNPFAARLLANTKLNGPAADKDTRFISLSLAGANLRFEPGDALGVWPSNCPDLVDEVLERAGLKDDARVAVDKAGNLPLRQALRDNFELTRPSRETLEFIAERSASPELKTLLAASRNSDLKQWLYGKQLADVLAAFPIKVAAQEFVAALKHIQPRLYSISSSPRAYRGEVHLTVAAVRYGSRNRKGTCSTFLADRAHERDVPMFVQASSHFRLPADPATPVIMIGPGTGIAPFRAFLQDRRVCGARGRNWLFFGERHQATDFYYRDELSGMRKDGFLTELSLAFSRDQAEKRYVQHCLTEGGADIWAWLQDGANLYVCGDAGSMARDVETTLRSIIERHGGLSPETAQDYLRLLAREKRYLRDVY
ncbi:MAG TPA: flavodoxin domain-containing protein, partial [Acidocella sp.]